jgi:hypothetical protein
MLKIEKVLSETALPLTKQQNIVNFVVPLEGSHMDMRNSYVQFQLDVQSAQSARLSLGQDGVAYHPVALVRRARLVSSMKGVISETYNLNILMENLLWNGRTTSEDQSEALMGWGSVAGQDYMHSVITDYNGEQNCMVKIPFEHLFPGTLGKEEEFPVTELGDLTVQLELEPTRNLFQQAVLPRWSGASSYDRSVYTGAIGATGLAAPSDVITLDVDAAYVYYNGQIVDVSYTPAVGDAETVQCVITAIGPADNQITINQEIPITLGTTRIEVGYDNTLIHCEPLAGSTGGVTPGATALTVPLDGSGTAGNLDPQQFTTLIPDVSAGPLPLQVEISYVTYPIAGGAISDVQTVQRKVIAVTDTAGQGPWTVTLDAALPDIAEDYNMSGINIKPLRVNVTDAVWQVQQAFLFPYRRFGKAEKVGKRMISTFTQEPLPQVSDGYSFSREVQVAGNAFSCFLLTPPASNQNQLLSVSDGVETYRFFLNDVALSTIPIAIRNSEHLDMLMRVFNNSDFPLRNLSLTKDSPWYIPTAPAGQEGKYVPATLVAKMKPKMILDEENVEAGAERKNLRVEMQGTGMATAKTIYFFKQEWKMI